MRRDERKPPSPPRGEGRGEGAPPEAAHGPRAGANKAAAARLTDLARGMRQAPTTPEARLWRALRGRQLAGLRFRRQAPLGRFIVDFYCPEAALVVEADGATHAPPGADEARDAWLRDHGLVVLRFWNNEVMGNLAGVLERIAAHALRERPPHPGPLPGGERGTERCGLGGGLDGSGARPPHPGPLPGGERETERRGSGGGLDGSGARAPHPGPLPGGERGAERGGLGGGLDGSGARPPHPGPLPGGERERTA